MSSSAEHGAHPPGAAEPAPLPAQPPLPPEHSTDPQPQNPFTAQPPLHRRHPHKGGGSPRRAPPCRRGSLWQRGMGILTHAPDDPGNPAEPPVPPGHALLGGGGRGLGGCCCCRRELLILRAHLPPAAGGSAPCRPPQPQGATPCSSQPRGRPLQPGLGLSPCPHAGPGPPRADNGGALAAERCQRAWSCSSVARAALWVPPGSRQGFGFDVTRIKGLWAELCRSYSSAEAPPRTPRLRLRARQLWVPPGTSGCCYPGKPGFAFPEGENPHGDAN